MRVAHFLCTMVSIGKVVTFFFFRECHNELIIASLLQLLIQNELNRIDFKSVPLTTPAPSYDEEDSKMYNIK